MTAEKIAQIPEYIAAYPVDLLVPYDKNARTHSEAQVAQIVAAIRKFGFTNPPLVDEADVLIAGHARLLAAKQLGFKAIPIIRIDYLSEVEKKACVLADNKLALNAGWDVDMLRLELEALKLADFDMGLTGFGESELLGIMGETDEEVGEQVEAVERFEFTVQCRTEKERLELMQELNSRGLTCRALIK